MIEGLRRTFDKVYRDRALTFAVDAPDGLAFSRRSARISSELIGNLFDNAGKWARQRSRRSPPRAIRGSNCVGRAYFIAHHRRRRTGPRSAGAQRGAAPRPDGSTKSRPGSGLGLSIVVDLAADLWRLASARGRARSAACGRPCGCRRCDPREARRRLAPLLRIGPRLWRGKPMASFALPSPPS